MHSLQNAQEERAARREAARLLKKTYMAVRLLTRLGPVEGISIRNFPRLPDLRLSGRVAAHIHEILELVERLDGHLARFLDGQAPSRLLREAALRLAQADAEQESFRKTLPELTLRLQERKGRVVECVETLHAIARIVFDDRPEIRRRFTRKELRARRRPSSARGNDPS